MNKFYHRDSPQINSQYLDRGSPFNIHNIRPSTPPSLRLGPTSPVSSHYLISSGPPPSFPLAFWGPIKNNKISAFTPSIRPSSPPPDENRPPIAPIRRPRPDFSPSPTDSIGTDSPYSIPHRYSISTPRNFLFPDFEPIPYSSC